MKKMFNPGILIILCAMVLLDVLNGRFENPMDFIMNTIMLLPAIVIGLSFHEFAHGIVSYKLGDPTPKIQGRLTINPAAHIDPFGFIALIFAGFGWGVPVQIDPRYYKHRRRDEALVAIAGVTMNLLIAIVFAFLVKLILVTSPVWLSGKFGEVLIEVLMNVVIVNIVLLVFNLLPVPPLDGFGLITQMFKLENTEFYWKIYDKGFFILLALIMLGVTDKVISPIINLIYGLILNGIIL